jgi:RNA polymerase sigma-70 factor (ECF subfamily)
MEAIQSLEKWIGLEDLRPALRRYLVVRCLDENEVDDVIQETLLRAARYRRGLHRPERLRSWVLRIAANVFRDRRRDSTRAHAMGIDEETAELPPSREVSPAESHAGIWLEIEGESIEREQALRLLARAFRLLRETDRAVLRSYYGGAESCARTAVECGMSPALVKVRLFRARRRLERRVRQSIICVRGARLAQAI